jgi:hypothetical protein
MGFSAVEPNGHDRVIVREMTAGSNRPFVPKTANRDAVACLAGRRVRLDAPPTPFPVLASLVAGHEPPKAHPHPPVNRQVTPGIGVELTHRSFQSDREAVIRRAVAAGVVRLISTGTTPKGSQGGLALARAHPGTVTTTAGVHPHNARDWTRDR